MVKYNHFGIFMDPKPNRKDWEAHRMSIIRLLANGESTWGKVKDGVNLAPRIVSKHLNELKKDGLVDSRSDGRKVLYSLTPSGIEFGKSAPYSLIWDLYEFQEKQAMYARGEDWTTSYRDYGLTVDIAGIPNNGCYWNMSNSMSGLEKGFMKALGEAVESEGQKKIAIYDSIGKNVTLNIREGKLLVAFQVDWPRFIEAYKRNGSKVVQDVRMRGKPRNAK